MMYRYSEQREAVFKEENQAMFLRIRDAAGRLTKTAGAASCEKLIAGCTGSTWEMIACVDRLVELGELFEIPNTRSSAGQHRLFVAPFRD